MLFLRKPKPEDAEQIKALYQASTSLHQPWCYPPSDYASYLADAYRYFLCLTDSGEIVGSFNISGVVRGYFQSAYLGYEVFLPHQGKGYMTIGIKLLLEEAFFQLKLHRLEANIQPENTSSIKLVSTAGFVQEGYSKHYLNIGGLGWKDHQRWAIVNHQWSGSGS